MRPSQSTLVLIPAYNAAANLPALLDRLARLEIDLPVLVVDDGSSDSTPEVAADYANTEVVRHCDNRGKGEALKTGFNWAQDRHYEQVLTLDADLQHPPEAIPSFFELARADRIVLGCRSRHAGGMPLDRRLSNFLTSAVSSIITGRRIPDSQCGMRLIPLELIRRLELRQSGFALESELLLQAARTDYEVASVPIPTVYEGGQSHISHTGDTWRFVSLVIRHLWR
jgi:glycosyltransferase involved in cell wall biosynthesis